MTASPHLATPASDASDMFELAPVSLWLEDFSGLRPLFESWRAEGVSDLRAHLAERPGRVAEGTSKIRVLHVNRRTLDLLGARDLDHLVDNLGTVFSGDMFDMHVDELVAFWEGRTEFTTRTINYTLAGIPLDVDVKATVLPGHEETWDRVMVSVEDVTSQVRAQQALMLSEQYARGLFQHSPVSLWVEDFREVKALLDGVRASGISDFRTFIDVHPEFIERCMQEIRVSDVNRQTLTLFGANDRDHLLRNLDLVFRDDMRRHFGDQLNDLWNGLLHQQRETVNYSLSGERVDVHMQFSVFPGHEDDWSLVLISLTDISARKKAEAYLEYLGKHDTLTTLRNRSYYSDEVSRLSRRGPWPVSVIMLDLNGLKAINDDSGHAAGDALLRRAGEVLAKAIDTGQCAARIGGDEFALLLPAVDDEGAASMIGRIRELVELNNQYYGGPAVDFAIGTSTCHQGENLEATLHIADKAMYVDKRSRTDDAP
ncbi:sensor domain-containing diguanylate cyclase [Nocardioides sp. Kera G14]|uniref:sensor domain-containing diguanylate cyclase n=1 Tax=Nocardioides sp. Kera G14 TaxID=2884264 RepID=UPI001D123534|nr:sensor domain-containing diguanylate cyclase [Nocardioides sp. Kera G14]UDY23353.1 diguanylate cyclase [Nocardioides sp. Kera G14]